MQPTARRLGAVLSGTALSLGALASVTPITPAAQATPAAHDTAPLQQAVAWLTGRLTEGALTTQYGPDYSTTGYLAEALQRIGGHDAELAPMIGALEAHAADQVSGGTPGEVYAGSTAKLAVIVAGAGDDPTDVGGTDLIATLEGQVRADGRTQDTSAWDDYANTIGQAYAVHALTEAGSTSADAATAFLLEQQCSGGWFRLGFSAKDAADQSCDADPASAPDPDATSFAILELADLAGTDETVATALDRAAAWLATQQKSDGSFGGGTSTESSNANSTGLAGWALGVHGDVPAAERAATWLRTLQVREPAGCTTRLSGETGALAYRPATLAAGRTSGISDAYQWQLAGAQAVAALQWLPATSSRPVITGPTGYQHAGATVTYRVAGALPGEPLCLALGATKRLVTAAAAGSAALAVRLPAGTATRTATVADHAGVRSSTVTQVLGAARPALRLGARTVKRGKRLSVTVAGLAARERVTIRIGRSVVRVGTTTTRGTYTTRVRVTRKVARPGRVTVRVTGLFADRTNRKTVRVVR